MATGHQCGDGMINAHSEWSRNDHLSFQGFQIQLGYFGAAFLLHHTLSSTGESRVEAATIMFDIIWCRQKLTKWDTTIIFNWQQKPLEVHRVDYFQLTASFLILSKFVVGQI